MLTFKQKQEIVQELSEGLKNAKSVVFSDYQTLKAGDTQKLRAELRDQGIVHKVVKITLLKRALKGAGVDTDGFDYQVPLSVTFSQDDEVAPAKILNTFAKENKSLEILGGVLDGEVIDISQVQALASLPTKQELRGQVVGAIAGPLRGLVGVLQGNFRNLVYVLKAVEESKT